MLRWKTSGTGLVWPAWAN